MTTSSRDGRPRPGATGQGANGASAGGLPIALPTGYECRMGLQYLYFGAEDDEAARDFMLAKPWPPPTYFNEEIRLDMLDEFENLLTGRPAEQIRADPLFLANVATQIDEDAGVEEWGIVSVTQTFTRALANSDLSTLPADYDDFVEPLRELAVVAQHAVAHGRRMYGAWFV
jgi:hypothetical protein